jgi:hypothetical protein
MKPYDFNDNVVINVKDADPVTVFKRYALWW